MEPHILHKSSSRSELLLSTNNIKVEEPNMLRESNPGSPMKTCVLNYLPSKSHPIVPDGMIQGQDQDLLDEVYPCSTTGTHDLDSSEDGSPSLLSANKIKVEAQDTLRGEYPCSDMDNHNLNFSEPGSLPILSPCKIKIEAQDSLRGEYPCSNMDTCELNSSEPGSPPILSPYKVNVEAQDSLRGEYPYSTMDTHDLNSSEPGSPPILLPYNVKVEAQDSLRRENLCSNMDTHDLNSSEPGSPPILSPYKVKVEAQDSPCGEYPCSNIDTHDINSSEPVCPSLLSPYMIKVEVLDTLPGEYPCSTMDTDVISSCESGSELLQTTDMIKVEASDSLNEEYWCSTAEQQSPHADASATHQVMKSNGVKLEAPDTHEMILCSTDSTMADARPPQWADTFRIEVNKSDTVHEEFQCNNTITKTESSVDVSQEGQSDNLTGVHLGVNSERHLCSCIKEEACAKGQHEDHIPTKQKATTFPVKRKMNPCCEHGRKVCKPSSEECRNSFDSAETLEAVNTGEIRCTRTFGDMQTEDSRLGSSMDSVNAKLSTEDSWLDFSCDIDTEELFDPDDKTVHHIYYCVKVENEMDANSRIEINVSGKEGCAVSSVDRKENHSTDQETELHVKKYLEDHSNILTSVSVKTEAVDFARHSYPQSRTPVCTDLSTDTSEFTVAHPPKAVCSSQDSELPKCSNLQREKEFPNPENNVDITEESDTICEERNNSDVSETASTGQEALVLTKRTPAKSSKQRRLNVGMCYKCNTCGLSFMTRSAMTKHRAIHMGDSKQGNPPSVLENSTERQNQRATLNLPKNNCFKRMQLCELCGKQFTRRPIHLDYHHNCREKSRVVSQGKSISSSTVKRGRPKVSTVPTIVTKRTPKARWCQYTCGVCRKLFETGGALLQHMFTDGHNLSNSHSPLITPTSSEKPDCLSIKPIGVLRDLSVDLKQPSSSSSDKGNFQISSNLPSAASQVPCLLLIQTRNSNQNSIQTQASTPVTKPLIVDKSSLKELIKSRIARMAGTSTTVRFPEKTLGMPVQSVESDSPCSQQPALCVNKKVSTLSLEPKGMPSAPENLQKKDVSTMTQ